MSDVRDQVTPPLFKEGDVVRVGEWKMTNYGAMKCIACGGGYVMVRQRGMPPGCLEVRVWDECFDYTCPPELDFPLDEP